MVESPCTATVLVLESVTDGKATDSAILVSCDAVAIPHHVRDKTREQVAKRLPIYVNKIILNGTHTHTGPVMTEEIYEIPADGS